MVSWAIHYQDGDNSWWGEIISSAPSEEMFGSDTTFDLAVDDMVEWLEKVLKGEHHG